MLRKPSRIIPIVLIFIILTLTGVFLYAISTETRTSFKESVQENLVSAAGIAASEIDGDAFARLQPGDENSPAFLHIRDQLNRIRNTNPKILFIYTMRQSGNTVEFVVDADYGIASDSPAIGKAYPEAEPELLAGFTRPSADNEFTTDEWGTVLSGFSLIRDSSGTVVGLVGVDMDSTHVQADMDRINQALYVLLFLALIAITIGIVVIEYQRYRDEEMLEESEKKFRTLFENAGAAILIMDKHRIVDCNHQTSLVFRGSREEILSRCPSDCSPESQPDGSPSVEMARTHMQKAFFGEPQFFEWVFTHCDGTPFIAEVSLNRIALQGSEYLQAIIQDISERKKAESALQKVTKKLTLLNALTFNEIRNAVFALNGFMSIERDGVDPEKLKGLREKEQIQLHKILKSLSFAKSYQDLGANPPKWQNVKQSFLLAISHTNFSSVSRSLHLENLEIYADPLLEQVFFSLADNVLKHARSATAVTIGFEEGESSLLIIFEDNGPGIPASMKEKIFEPGIGGSQSMALFLAREILSITGITIRETGTEGMGARFEMSVPHGVYRFTDRAPGSHSDSRNL